jgi:hypothetical protein
MYERKLFNMLQKIYSIYVFTCGLFLVMIGYVALGGVVFQALESGNEYNMRSVMGEKLDSTLLKIMACNVICESIT